MIFSFMGQSKESIAKRIIVGLFIGSIAIPEKGATGEPPAPTTSPAAPQTPTPIGGLPQFTEIVKQALPCVVNISTKQSTHDKPDVQYVLPPGSSNLETILRDFFDNGGEHLRKTTPLGSGFIIDSAGYILTNYHVVADVEDISVTFYDDTELKARIVGKDKRSDVALLKVNAEKPLPVISWGDSDVTRVGEWVFVIGNPFGLGSSVTAGIISHKARDIPMRFDASIGGIDYIQTDAAVNRGNSGGPLFAMDGRIIGMITAVFSEPGVNSGLNFAIPSNVLRKNVEQLRKFGKVKRGWLGVYVDPLSDDVAESLGLGKAHGGVVVRVFSDSPAARAGLQLGDIIIAIDDKPIINGSKLQQLVADLPIGQVLPIKVIRKSKELTLSIAVGDRDELGDDTDEGTLKPISEAPKGKYIPPLKLSVSTISPDLAQLFDIPTGMKQGVVITSIKKSSDAVEKDVRQGDLITRVNQDPVANILEFEKKINAAQTARPSVALLIYRDGVSFYRALTFKEKKSVKETRKSKNKA
ncbi:MAG: Do family serine endopeptidase [Holosporales bacterium]|jgi:serine protease Do|nr:Do family serine endopeptidase [Holosporales bacterium]